MTYVDIFNNVITIISLITNLFFILPFIYNITRYFRRNRYIEKILSYDKKSVSIYLGTHRYDTIENFKYDFITYEALEATQNVLGLFNIMQQKYVFVNQVDYASNEMCIGGFLVNKRVNTYFSKYFGNFRYYVDMKYKDAYENYPVDTKMLEYSEEKTGFKIDEEIFLETDTYKKDYAFLIKLTGDDFKTESKKTTHILFGGRSIGTIKATEYLSTQYKEIYHKYGNKHYFFAIEINLVDNSFNHKNGIIDLTDKMFCD